MRFSSTQLTSFFSRMAGLLSLAGLVVVSAAGLESSAKASGGYGSAGCGLGAMVMGSKPGFMQVFAATTNNSTVPQTSAISTGTLGCTATGARIGYIQQRDYIANNISSLSREASQGNGEILLGFAEVLGCDSAVHDQFSKVMQASFQSVFTRPGTESILEASRKVVSEDSILSQSCLAI